MVEHFSVNLSSLVILATAVFDILCRKTDKCRWNPYSRDLTSVWGMKQSEQTTKVNWARCREM